MGIAPAGREAGSITASRNTNGTDFWVRRQRSWSLNRQFHEILDNASGNAHLAATLSRLAILSGMYVNLCLGLRDSFRSRAASEHRQLIEAYQSGDVERAIDININHLAATVAAAEAAFPGADAIGNQ